ncbi:MAG: metalloregulator ArsR/SmtB family transcription factor [Acidobacteriota bacterium]|nr:metalloregulator ArsR/SmtB family transcription factor [Acidobacteriota bacterium]MDH3528213.1 metalloregulator ArsR/SmtB family transcription factor [Acidobacteriota bacterium]
MAVKKTKLDEMETVFAALADQTRLRLLNLMRDEEVCVCFFTEVLNESQPKISRHLAYLRKAGLVDSRREGKWVHYGISDRLDPMARTVLDNVLEWLGSQEVMTREHEELVAACCSLDVPVTIARAPKPEALVEREEIARPKPEPEIETYLL